jgi:DNA-binding Lrp family transcriptional regulator
MNDATCKTDINKFSQAVNLTPNETMAIFQQLAAKGFLHKVGTSVCINEKGRNAIKITRNIPDEKAFYFYVGEDKPIGFSARSIEEFYRLIKQVTSEALDFHVLRGDFENWLREVIGDRELALDISGLRAASLRSEDLRKRLLNVIDYRYGINEILVSF